jgi:hypothetical protein
VHTHTTHPGPSLRVAIKRDPGQRFNENVRLIEILVLMVIIAVASAEIRTYCTLDNHKKRLIMLEDYRFKFKSLPDEITLSKIIDTGPGKLKKKLKDAGDLIVKRGHI